MMKKIVLFLLISNLIFSITIKTSAQDSSPKFFNKSGTNEVVGICIDVMREIEKIEPSLKFVGDQSYMPLSRIESELEKGNLDCFVGFIKTEERNKKYIFIDIPIYYVKNILISRKNDKVEIKNLEEIKKLKDNLILMVFGVGQSQTLKKQGYNIDEGGKNLEANFDKLIQGRGRFIYQSEIEIKKIIKDKELEELVKIQPFQGEVSGRYIAFSKKSSPETIKKVTNALEKLKNNGTLDRIFKKYVN